MNPVSICLVGSQPNRGVGQENEEGRHLRKVRNALWLLAA